MAIAEQVTAPTMVVEVIGPDKAREYLALLAPNRHYRPAVVSQYARDMRADRWFTSVLRFGSDGLLYDGQHRLRAVIESGTEQLFWVERGMPPEAMTTIDVGVRRTMGDIFTLSGETSANVLAAATRLARFLTIYPGTAPSGANRVVASVAEIAEYLDANPDIRHSVAFGQRLGSAIRFTPSTSAAIHYLSFGRNRPAAAEFWEQILTGAGMEIDTGPYALREKIREDRAKPPGTRMDSNMLVAVTIKAWNFWEYGKKVKQLRWLRGGESAERFPVMGRKPE